VRIAVFTDANNANCTAIIGAFARLVDDRDDVELCAVVTARPQVYLSTRREEARRWLRRIAVAAANRGTGAPLTRRTRLDLFGLARARDIPVLVPPATGINDPEFVARLVDTAAPDLGFSCYCMRIWKAPLLDALPRSVNYHDGALPRYRGVAATSFSVYHDEPTSGFTYHRMSAGIDEGPILVQGAVPIGDRTFGTVDRAKAEAAVAALPEVLDRIVADDPGRAQAGDSSYFSGRDLFALAIIPDPAAVTADELQHRIRAFGTVQMTIDGDRWPVTRIRPGNHGRLTFRSADGAWCTADRVRGLPARLTRPIPKV